MSRNMMSSTAAAKFLGVAPSTVTRWADEGRLQCVRTQGGHRRFLVSDLRELHDANPTPKSWYERLPEMSVEELDALEMGVIQLDDAGRVLQYNAAEAMFSGYGKSDVLGKIFFVDVAPCTNNRLVYGRFREGVRTGQLNHSIPYTFTYVMEPTVVLLQLYRHNNSRTNWLLVTHCV